MELKDLCHVKDFMATVVQLEAQLRHATGLNLNQAFALCCLAKGPLSAGELAEQLRIHGASLSRILKTLAAKGYLLRDHSDEDSRRTVLSLTPEGQSMSLTLAGCEQSLFPLPIQGSGVAEIK